MSYSDLLLAMAVMTLSALCLGLSALAAAAGVLADDRELVFGDHQQPPQGSVLNV
jgi:hypothetical protein